jgi:F-type H+-transporting ATPase subunit delta
MRSVKIANRYAKSLLLLAKEHSLVEEIAGDMKLLVSVGAENRDFQILLKSPVVKKDKKISILDALFAADFQKITMMFLHLITRKNREGVMLEIAESFLRQYREMKGIKDAVVTTATMLSDLQRQTVESRLKIWAKGDVNITYNVNPDIIAGIVVRMEDVEYNGSVASKLLALRQDFSKNPFIPQL